MSSATATTENCTLVQKKQNDRTVFFVALAVRLAVVVWAADAIPPTADGSYYATFARRLAEGHGYTWAWPDGAVTYAAHYPVGYPALVAGLYVILGSTKPWIAMLLNAVLGTVATLAIHDLLFRATRPRLALAGALAVALHPVLVPYTAAFMTEGVTASLLAIAAAVGVRAGRSRERRGALGWLVACGVLMGIATLVRPQSLMLAPVFGALAAGTATRTRRARAQVLAATMVTGIAVLVCAPWTARNCVRMEQCALVSVNGGWNLAIGTQTKNGAWQELDVPASCREVWQEAAKDACFGREALRAVRVHPLEWLARAPAKLGATFDYFGAAPWYLHAANPTAFPHRAKAALGVIETLVSRALLVAALVAVARREGPRRRARTIACGVGLAACVLLGVAAALSPGAFGIFGAGGAIGYLALAIGIALLGVRELAGEPLLAATCAVVLATAATHAIFFGAGRYGLVVVPFVAAVAFVRRNHGIAGR